jgi:hypothetical protein
VQAVVLLFFLMGWYSGLSVLVGDRHLVLMNWVLCVLILAASSSVDVGARLVWSWQSTSCAPPWGTLSSVESGGIIRTAGGVFTHGSTGLILVSVKIEVM